MIDTALHIIKTSDDLLAEFRSNDSGLKGEKLVFDGVDGMDVYNITAPFEDDGEMIIAGRVEERNSEYSKIMFFSCRNNVWSLCRSRTFKLQDPFYSRIGGNLVLGGVEVFPNTVNPDKLNWRTVFYKGKDINGLKLLTKGPDGMKDIRLVELPAGKIGVFTRPQGSIGGRGRIGFIAINSLDELNSETILKAELIKGQFSKGEWGGANELHALNNGIIGVLGHIASYDDARKRHYYAMAFSFNPVTGEASPIKIIATRANFEPGPAKMPDLQDVIFSGGLVRLGSGKAALYAGVSDVEAHRIIIPDPFDEYER